MAPKNKDVEKVRKQLEDFKKLAKKMKPADLFEKVDDYYRAPVKILLIENGERKLKQEFDKFHEDLEEAAQEA